MRDRLPSLRAPRKGPGPSERLAVLEAENRNLRERVERLERLIDRAGAPPRGATDSTYTLG